MQPGLLHFAQSLVDDTKPLISQRRAKWITNGHIQFMGLLLQANGFMNMHPPAANPSNQVQCKCLTAPISHLSRQLVRLPQGLLRLLCTVE